MPRRVNVFGQPLSYDVGVSYLNGKPVDRNRPLVEGDDVSDVTIQTTVEYVERLTTGAEGGLSNANEFPLSGPPVKRGLVGQDGNPPPLSDPPSSQEQFVGTATADGRTLNVAALKAISNSSLQPNGLARPGDATFVRKGKSSSGEADGNELLAGVSLDKRVSDRYVSPALSNNRFNVDRTLTSVAGNDKRFNPQRRPEGFGSYCEYQREQGGADLSDGQLANVGVLLTLRATKELNASSPTAYGHDGPDGTAAAASALLPGGAQSGLFTVPADDLTAASALEALIAGGTDPVNVTEGADGPRQVISLGDSYGQANNVLEQFSGLLPLGTVAAAAALAVALNVALRAALAVFLLITNASSSSSTKRDSIGRYIPGDSRFNPAFDKTSFPPVPLPAKLFGLLETSQAYGDAVDEGIRVFFGGNIGGQLQRVLESPGFYLLFCRSITRSAASLANILKDVGRGNPIQVAENIVGFVEAIRASKVVSVLNVFAQIGDVSLLTAARQQRFGTNADSVDGDARPADSEVDNMEGLDAMRARRRGSLATAWGCSTAKSMYLLPTTTAAALLAASPGSLSTLLSDRTNVENKLATDRISREDVDRLEAELDAEYVPFYFHDLRTNEIVSFHAFLENLTESFTPSYDSVESYGRVDSVKGYKSTSRKIGVDFFVAATSQEDFDGMWAKINKLVTLVYPQWNAGTELNVPTDGTSFVQPFSQVPSASPLVRVRVGDLWTSNYSKFSLARLFGLGTDKFQLNGEQVVDSVGDVTSKVSQVTDELGKRLGPTKELPANSVWLLEPGDYEADNQDQGALGAAATAAVSAVTSLIGAKSPSAGRVTAKLRNYTRVKVLKTIDKSNGNAYAVAILDVDGLPDAVKNASILVSKSHLTMAADTLASMNIRVESLDSPGPLADGNNLSKTSALAKFFSVDSNAVVRSFESYRGRGLACTIDGMTFDWYSKGPWETTLAGSRAPKLCKVTLSMEVVHDIAPGLDAFGANRAPVYSVGRLSNAMSGKDPSDPSSSKFGESMKLLRKSLI